jgi:hypothetical protein
MRDEHRLALASVLHPVQRAAESVGDHSLIAADPAAAPTADEVLRALEVLHVEVARARTLVQQLADRS